MRNGGIIVDHCYESSWNVIYNRHEIVFVYSPTLPTVDMCSNRNRTMAADAVVVAMAAHRTDFCLSTIEGTMTASDGRWRRDLCYHQRTANSWYRSTIKSFKQSRSSTARCTSLQIVWDEAVVLDWRHWIKRHYAFWSGMRRITNIQFRGRINEIKVCSYLSTGGLAQFRMTRVVYGGQWAAKMIGKT